jgi:hypothetical protein
MNGCPQRFGLLPGRRLRCCLACIEGLPPPALGERRHRRLAHRLVAVRWRPVLMVAVHSPMGMRKMRPTTTPSSSNVVLFLIPADRRAFEDQLGHFDDYTFVFN